MLTLGLCGRARHGKDFAAEVIKQFCEARDLKVFLSSVSEVVLRSCQRRGLIDSGKKRADLDRKELDTLVREGHKGRAVREDFWWSDLELSIDQMGPDVVIIPGIRFPNEVSKVRRECFGARSNRGSVARVKRYNPDGSVYISPDRDPNDPMETCIERVLADYEISATTGQEAWLIAQAHALARHILDERQ